VKYLIVIHSNPRSRAVWETLSDEQRMDLGVGHLKLTEELAASGELVVSEGLADPSLAKWVSVRDGETIAKNGSRPMGGLTATGEEVTAVASDGPFAEVKEYLAGFYLVECDSLERAIAWAAKVPDATYGEVEVRPVLDMSGWEY
jgi:hypothetical protein